MHKNNSMAKFTYTRTVESYSFTPPSFISEDHYNELKKQISKQPNSPLINENKVEKSHQRLKALVSVGTAALIIGVLVAFNSSNPPTWSIILIFLSVFGILHPIVNMGTYASSKNRLETERRRINYYRQLKRILLETEGYQNFIVKYSMMYRSNALQGF
jgi:hypothetical protein